MAAGYSGTPLAKKLGLRAGMRIRIEGAPDTLREVFEIPGITTHPRGKEVDYAHVFSDRVARLRTRFPVLRDAIRKDGMLWVSWPKKAAGVPTDVDEAVVRDIGLSSGLVDVKVCAVDEVWSGLKFVWRTKDR